MQKSVTRQKLSTLFAKKDNPKHKMKLLSLFLFTMIVAFAFIDPASSQSARPLDRPVAPTPHPDPRHHSHKKQEYHLHIFRKREVVDFPEYEDSHI
jgi:hypothetical protein